MNSLLYLLTGKPHRMPWDVVDHKHYFKAEHPRTSLDALVEARKMRTLKATNHVLSGMSRTEWRNAYEVARLIDRAHTGVRANAERMTKEGLLEDRWNPVNGKVYHEWRIKDAVPELRNGQEQSIGNAG